MGGVNERWSFFTEIVMAMISGTFRDILEENADEILGVSFHLYKKSWKIEIWNKNGKSKGIRRIDLALRELLNVENREAFSIKYCTHDGVRTETWMSTKDTSYMEDQK